jgi:hypothetical protein
MVLPCREERPNEGCRTVCEDALQESQLGGCPAHDLRRDAPSAGFVGEHAEFAGRVAADGVDPDDLAVFGQMDWSGHDRDSTTVRAQPSMLLNQVRWTLSHPVEATLDTTINCVRNQRP